MAGRGSISPRHCASMIRRAATTASARRPPSPRRASSPRRLVASQPLVDEAALTDRDVERRHVVHAELLGHDGGVERELERGAAMVLDRRDPPCFVVDDARRGAVLCDVDAIDLPVDPHRPAALGILAFAGMKRERGPRVAGSERLLGVAKSERAARVERARHHDHGVGDGLIDGLATQRRERRREAEPGLGALTRGGEDAPGVGVADAVLTHAVERVLQRAVDPRAALARVGVLAELFAEPHVEHAAREASRSRSCKASITARSSGSKATMPLTIAAPERSAASIACSAARGASRSRSAAIVPSPRGSTRPCAPSVASIASMSSARITARGAPSARRCAAVTAARRSRPIARSIDVASSTHAEASSGQRSRAGSIAP